LSFCQTYEHHDIMMSCSQPHPRGGPLATLDGALRAAAGSLGVEPFGEAA
jgi:hypothetical protein